jgi:indolepyruvate ferredoxin oxidoreductase, beta subunit
LRNFEENVMKKDIIIAGVGGQGILSIAAAIGYAALEAGLHFKQSEVHGMSQRGGEVQSHFRLSDKPVASDLIPEGKADLIISVEPMEALRYIPMLSNNGWLITNTRPYINISNYPDIELILIEIGKYPRHIAIDADKLAKEIGSPKSANIILLGAASKYLEIGISIIENALRTIFAKKGEAVVEANLKALKIGQELAIG